MSKQHTTLQSCVQFMQQQAIITQMEHEVLSDLVAGSDPVLDAAFRVYRADLLVRWETWAANPLSELTDTCLRVLAAWRRAHPHGTLLQALHTLSHDGVITFAERESLEISLIQPTSTQQQQAATTLLAAWEQHIDQLRGASEFIITTATREFQDTLFRILDRAILIPTLSQLQSIAIHLFRALSSRNWLSPVEETYLWKLIHHMIPHEQQHMVLYAAVQTYVDHVKDPEVVSWSPAMSDLAGTWLRVASTWSELLSDTAQQVLKLVNAMTKDHYVLTSGELEWLQFLISREDDDLFSAYREYLESADQSQAWSTWVNTIYSMCEIPLRAGLIHRGRPILHQLIHEMMMSPADATYLMERWEAADSLLLATLDTYLQHEVSREETYETLTLIGRTWRSHVNPHEVSLLDTVDQLSHEGVIDHAAWQTLEEYVYHEHPVLLAAWDVLTEARANLAQGSSHVISPWSDFLDTLTRLIPSSSIQPLSDQSATLQLVNDVIAYDARNGIPSLSQTGIISLREMVKLGDMTLQAIIANYQATQDWNELVDNFSSLSGRWLRHATHGDMSQLIDAIHYLCHAQLMTWSESEILLSLAYSHHPSLIHPYRVYQHACDDGDTSALYTLYDTLLSLLDQHITWLTYGDSETIRNIITSLEQTQSTRFKPVQIMHLEYLLECHDEVLFAAVLSSHDDISCDPSSITLSHELIETLERLSHRWRRTTSHVTCLVMLELSHSNGWITRAQRDITELLLWHEDPELITLYTRYIKRHDLFAKKLIERLNKIEDTKWNTLADTARTCISELDHQHIITVTQAEWLYEQVRVRNPVILAAVDEFGSTSNVVELVDTLVHMASRWRLQSTSLVQSLSTFIDSMVSLYHLSPPLHEHLLSLCIRQDEEIIKMYHGWQRDQDQLVKRLMQVAIQHQGSGVVWEWYLSSALSWLHSSGLLSLHDEQILLDAIHQHHPAIHAAIALHQALPNTQKEGEGQHELVDTLFHVATSWRRSSHVRFALLSWITAWYEAGALTAGQVHELELRVSRDDEVLMAAFANFKESIPRQGDLAPPVSPYHSHDVVDPDAVFMEQQQQELYETVVAVAERAARGWAQSMGTVAA